MSKIKSIGVQFSNSTVRMYMNDPVVELEMGSGRDTSPYRLKINGDTIGCETVAKLIIDDKIYTFADPYITPTYQDQGWGDEEVAWKRKLGLDCFSTIQEALGTNMIDQFLDTPFPTDDVVQKRKRQIEMQISKELYEKRKEREEEKRREEKRREEEKKKLKENQQAYSLDPGYGISAGVGGGTVYIGDVIASDSDNSVGVMGVSFSREELEALKEAARNMKLPV